MGNFFFRKYENYFNIIHSSNYILMKFSSKRKYYHWDKQIIVIISNTTLYNKYFLISSLTPCWSNLCNNIFLYVPFIIYIRWKLRKILSIWLMNSILIYVWFPEPVYLEQKYHSHRKKKGKKNHPENAICLDALRISLRMQICHPFAFFVRFNLPLRTYLNSNTFLNDGWREL